MTLKIVALSDTHQLHNKISVPGGDILVHTGDFTNRGKISEFENFINWFADLPHINKILIAGNHELQFEYGPNRDYKLNLIKLHNIIYLENSFTIIDGLKIYGSPHVPQFGSWEFMKPRGKILQAIWSNIPNDTNILLTHGPAYNRLDLVQDSDERDQHQGCQDLLARINELKQLKLHVSGHLHYNGGQTMIHNNVIFANAAICDDSYNPIHSPIVIDL